MSLTRFTSRVRIETSFRSSLTLLRFVSPGSPAGCGLKHLLAIAAHLPDFRLTRFTSRVRIETREKSVRVPNE